MKGGEYMRVIVASLVVIAVAVVAYFMPAQPQSEIRLNQVQTVSKHVNQNALFLARGAWFCEAVQ
jgi:hypothetical protein